MRGHSNLALPRPPLLRLLMSTNVRHRQFVILLSVVRPSPKLFENEYELRTLIRTRFHFYCAALSTQYDGWPAAVIFVFELLVFHV